MLERRAIVGKLLHAEQQMLIDLGLLPRKHVNIAFLEVAQKLLLDPSLPARESAFGDIEVAVRQALQPMNFGERGLNRLQERAGGGSRRRRCLDSDEQRQYCLTRGPPWRLGT